MFYENRQSTADRLLRKYGAPREITLVIPLKDENSETPWEPSEDETSVTVFGVVLQANKSTLDALDIRFDAGTLVEENVRMVLLSAKDLDVTPKGGDRVVFDSATWSVLGNTPLSPGGIPLLHRLGVMQ